MKSISKIFLVKTWLTVILYLLVIGSAACNSSSDPGIDDTSDGDIDTDRDPDLELVEETDEDIDKKSDPDTDFEIPPKTDGDLDPDIETEIEADGDPEFEADGDPDPDDDSEIEVERDTEIDVESDFEQDIDFDFYNEDLGWPVTLRGELRTNSRNVNLKSYFELYRDNPPVNGSVATSVHSENPAPYRIPGGLAYRFVFHQETGTLFWLRGAVDLNNDGQFVDSDLEQEFGTVIDQPFNIPTGESKKDILIYLNYRDPTLGSISGKIITKAGYVNHPYQVLVFEQVIDLEDPPDLSPFSPAELEAPDQEAGTIAYHVPNLSDGTYYLYSNIRTCQNDNNSSKVWIALPGNPLVIELDGTKDLENLDLDYRAANIECNIISCLGDEGNEIGVGKACDYGGAECDEGLVCAKDLFVDAPGICTKEGCLGDFNCGSGALCGGDEVLSFCIPVRCLDPDNTFCPGDEGNEVGVGKTCTIDGGECPEPTVCGLDGEGLLLNICLIMDCQSGAVCGSDAICLPSETGSALCLPTRCLEQENFCPGDDLGNNFGVGKTCTPGGEECLYFTQCLSDWYPGQPSICTYIDCGDDWMCGEDAYCSNRGDYRACFPNTCQAPFPTELCIGGEGNEIGVGKTCSKSGGECPFPTVCPADLNDEVLNVCLKFDCDTDEDCGSEAICFDNSEFGMCFPERCAEIIDCIGDAGNELGVGIACTAGGGECSAGTACLADLHTGDFEVCTIPDCTSHEMCGSEAACLYDSVNARHLCIPYRCGAKYIAELGCEGDAGNDLGVGRSCTIGGGQCRPGSVCLKDLNLEEAPEMCVILHCTSNADCGGDATCVDMGVANMCAPNRCFLIELSRGAENAGPVSSDSQSLAPLKPRGVDFSLPIYPPNVSLDSLKNSSP